LPLEVTKNVITQLFAIKRRMDILAHFQTLDLALMLPGCDANLTLLVAQRLYKLLMQDAFGLQSGQMHVTMGIASVPEHGGPTADIIGRARDAQVQASSSTPLLVAVSKDIQPPTPAEKEVANEAPPPVPAEKEVANEAPPPVPAEKEVANEAPPPVPAEKEVQPPIPVAKEIPPPVPAEKEVQPPIPAKKQVQPPVPDKKELPTVNDIQPSLNPADAPEQQ
jgi:hypothetical protein